jgi:hypothetical protein
VLLRDEDFTTIMVDCNKNKLIQLATLFRAAIMQSEPESLIITLHRFPKGSCGDASLLLAKYLEENNCGQFEYICGDRKDHSHAWLEKNGLIIDITADQFQDQDCPIFVSEDHSWHSQFEVDSRRPGNFMLYDENTVSILTKSYRTIMKTIEATQQINPLDREKPASDFCRSEKNKLTNK